MRTWIWSPTRRPASRQLLAFYEDAVGGDRQRVHQGAEGGGGEVGAPEGYLGEVDAIDAHNGRRDPLALDLYGAGEVAHARGGEDFLGLEMF